MKQPPTWGRLVAGVVIAALVLALLIGYRTGWAEKSGPAADAAAAAARKQQSAAPRSKPMAGDDADAPLAAKAKAANADVPLQQVVLFNSGVGYFEHRSEVDGDAQLTLSFNVEEIDDLLKSLVVQDAGGGRITAVTYESRAPVERVLKTFAIDLTENPSLAELLQQIRGAAVQIEAPNPITGTVVSIETQKHHRDDEVFETQFLNLRTDEGLRSIPLKAVSNLRLLDEQLNRELTQALAVLATSHDAEEKAVTFNFLGEGMRPVRLGYIQETPVWKMSYRLVMKNEGEPLLQGWAIVENTSSADWREVALTLVSGRPISYVMPLYEPLFVDRPVVELELYSSLRPQKYEQELDLRQQRMADEAAPMDRLIREEQERRQLQLGARPGAEALAKSRRAPAAPAARPALEPAVPSVAQAGEVGELFQYAVETPVTIARHESAMLPVVNAAIDGEKLSIYNPSVQPKHPLNGVRLKNTTDLFLMQGPITVFDEGVYAGDALLENLPPDAQRLISYALDLDVEVAPESKGHPQELLSVRIAKGTLFTTYKQLREQVYAVKNSADRERKVLVEYPRDPNWNLVPPLKPAETTRDSYRFLVEAASGETARLTIEEERVIRQQVALTNVDHETMLFYIKAETVSREIRQALDEIVRRKQEIEELAARRKQLQEERETIVAEQDRIRKNMEQIDRTSELYNRYLKKFGTQEDRIEDLHDQIAQLQREETSKRQALDEYMLGLDLD